VGGWKERVEAGNRRIEGRREATGGGRKEAGKWSREEKTKE
jgi:hypothetical protein